MKEMGDAEDESEGDDDDDDDDDDVLDEPQHLHEQPWSTLPTVPNPTERGQTSRLRKRRIMEADEENMCADEDCEKRIDEVDLLSCNAPGCGLTVSDSTFTFSLLNLPWTQYHLTCQGLFEKPSGGWFCDDECKKNAGWRVGSRKRRRRE
jgi:hypothetical protein